MTLLLEKEIVMFLILIWASSLNVSQYLVIIRSSVNTLLFLDLMIRIILLQLRWSLVKIMFDESGVSWSAAADVRRFAHCQLGHGPDSRLGWGKRNAFLISGRARQFAWLRDPTASLVFHIRSCNIKVKLAHADSHFNWTRQSCSNVLVKTNLGH